MTLPEIQNIILIEQGDITEYSVDAIVNAANSSLAGGGGVDGAIHRAAGPDLLKECLKIGYCGPGKAVITSGYNSNAVHIIHTVGPVWNGGTDREDKILSECYNNSLKLAVVNNIRTIAFPCISTGIYGYPFKEASEIAVTMVMNFLKENEHNFKKIYFIIFSEKEYLEFKDIYSKIFNTK